MKINGQRLLSDLKNLREITATPGQGVTRFSYSDEDRRAREYLARIAHEYGFTMETDLVGNITICPLGSDGCTDSSPGQSNTSGSVGSTTSSPCKGRTIIGSHIDTVKSGGWLDGTEAAAIMIGKRLRLSVGQIVLTFNVLIYLTAGALFGLDRGLYSLLTYFIVSKVVDFINTGMQQGKAVMIITDHGKEIAEDIYRTLGRTVTLIEGSGLISGEKIVLYCVITRIELSSLRKLVEKQDYTAFMTVSDVSEIVGTHIKSTSALKTVPPTPSDEAGNSVSEEGEGE